MISPNSQYPYQICVCGYSGSGKTTLLSKLIKKMSANHTIGYVKTDAHKFAMDKPGKDTDTAWKNGASQVAISDPTHSALISSNHFATPYPTTLINCDIVFLEGRKESNLPKVLMLDRDHKILAKVNDSTITNVLAYVGESECNDQVKGPYFQRDNIAALLDFIENLFNSSEYQVPVFGLVLAGGFSKRMKRDKATIQYHGVPQVEHCYRLLSQHCAKSIVSARAGQLNSIDQTIPQIHDRFCNFGPMGGILSAMLEFPHAAWLVVACDLPLLAEKTIAQLISERDKFKMATYFKAYATDLPEPLCAIYEPKSRFKLMESLAFGGYCPRKVLMNSPCKSLPSPGEQALCNVNYIHEYEKTKTELEGVCP